MVNAGDKDGQQIGEQLGLFLEVEGQGTVISKSSIKIDRPQKGSLFLTSRRLRP